MLNINTNINFTSKKFRLGENQRNEYAGFYSDRAKSDLAVAKLIQSNPDTWVRNGGEIYLEDAGFHCEQAVEKAIKAVGYKVGINTQANHDVAKALSAIEREVQIPRDLNIPHKIKDLEQFAVIRRYPDANTNPEKRYNFINDSKLSSLIKMTEKYMNWSQKTISNLDTKA